MHFFVLKHEKQRLSYIHTKFEGDKNNRVFFLLQFILWEYPFFCPNTENYLGLRGWCPWNYVVWIGLRMTDLGLSPACATDLFWVKSFSWVILFLGQVLFWVKSFFWVKFYHWLHIGTPVATLPGAWCYRARDWLVWCQYTVTGWDRKFDLHLLSQCGSTHCLSRRVLEIH